MNLAPELRQTLRQTPLTRQELDTKQFMDRVVFLTHRERRLARHMQHCGRVMVKIRKERYKLCRNRGLTVRWIGPHITRLTQIAAIGLTLLLAVSTFGQTLNFTVAKSNAVAAAAALPTPQVTANLMWNGAPGETNTYDFAGYVVSWSTNVDMNNAAVVLLPVIWSYRFTNLPPVPTIYFTCSSYGQKDSRGMDRGIQIQPPAKLTWNRMETPKRDAWIYAEISTNAAAGPFYSSDLPVLIITNLVLNPGMDAYRLRIERH